MSILLIEEFVPVPRPEELADQVRGYPGLALLRSGFFESQLARYSFLAVKPFLTFRSNGAHCEVQSELGGHVQFGNPWHVLREWLGRYELLDEVDFPFPLGGCFGYWGYDLKNFTEPKLTRRARNDLELPDCHLGFYGSLVVIDHRLDKSWIVCTGLAADGSRSEKQARRDLSWWKRQLRSLSVRRPGELSVTGPEAWDCPDVFSNISGETFVQQVKKAQSYIRAGDIYQVNLSHRLSVRQRGSGWNLFQLLSSVSPAPFAAYIDCGDFQIASSSPEMFLRMTGRDIVTRPIKGTRPRSADSIRDSQLAYELQTSAKETAELVMITDLLRNDLGKVCEFGSVQTPELLRLERYPQVQHLVSTVKGSLRARTSHLDALAACFPGGSVTGAPKFRAMEIIDELEPAARGPYTGTLGYLGFNRESQLSITIRTAICKGPLIYFPVGAGIVADSDPAAEYEETLIKARGFFEALRIGSDALVQPAADSLAKDNSPSPFPTRDRPHHG